MKPPVLTSAEASQMTLSDLRESGHVLSPLMAFLLRVPADSPRVIAPSDYEKGGGQ